MRTIFESLLVLHALVLLGVSAFVWPGVPRIHIGSLSIKKRHSSQSLQTYSNRVHQLCSLSAKYYQADLTCTNETNFDALSASEAERVLLESKNVSVYMLNQVLLKYRIGNKPEEAFQLLKHFSLPTSRIRPDIYSYSIVIHAFALNGNTERAQQVFDLAAKKDSLNINVYNALLSAYANAKNVNKCIKILDGLLEKTQGVCGSLVPNVVTYSTVINVMCKEGMIDEAKKLLDTMIANDVQPNVITYNSILAAWSRKAKRYSDKDAAMEAERLLNNMERRSLEYSPPDVVSFCTVIHALCNANEPQRAEAVLFRMEEKERLHVKSSHTYNALLTCWAKSNVNGAPIRVERLLLRMLQRYRDGITSVKPDKYSYQALIDSYAKCENVGSAEKAEAILLQMDDKSSTVKPNVYHYNSVLSAWARRCDAYGAQKAESILLQMEGRTGKFSSTMPNAMSYSCVIDAWGKSKQIGSAKRALNILDRMNKRTKDGFKSCTPTIVTYNLVLNALINDPTEGIDSAEKCINYVERKFRRSNVEWTEDDIAYTFSTMVNIYTKIGGYEAIEKAEGILKRMKNLGIRQTPAVFNSVINVYAQSGVRDAAQKAEILFSDMIEDGIVPDICTYNSILKCWSRSDDDEKVVRSFKIFDKTRLTHAHAGGHDLLITYNTFLSCCASSEIGRYNTFDIALSAYRDAQNSSIVHADHITYATFLKVCAKFLHDRKRKETIVKKVFKSCCKDGQVSNLVLKSLHSSVSKDLYCTLLEGAFRKGCVSLLEIPSEWTCNVPQVPDRSQKLRGIAKRPEIKLNT